MAWCPEKSICVDVSLDNEKYDDSGEKCFQNHLRTSKTKECGFAMQPNNVFLLTLPVEKIKHASINGIDFAL